MPPPPTPTPTLPIDPFDDPEDDIPLQQKRPFGSGLYKQKITFVPASSSLKTISDASPPPPEGKSISDLYLSLVLPSPPKPPISQESTPDNPPEEDPPLCPTCHLPLGPNHHLSLPHQLSLPHSHPPSSLDRTRMGLQHLTTLGWDPDSRRGLGPNQQGIQHPIKPKPKDDKHGLGVELPKPGTTKPPKIEPPPKKLLDAKKVRKQYEQDKKAKGRIMKELYGGDSKIERYLGRET
ncbi:hypothetical protein QBC41DRAFT_29020 [Cercophora samala]|uniref:G-patch domain-containing protein n=1 Tax=Cercophora samala TaxID=330535 RepID=A0AA40DFZ6_9PEZI|nr:hypothetical protein QBC41DRAFT_29020 [Cercophora samala]